MKFRFFTGDKNWTEYGGTFISPKLNNGEFNYWLAIRVINWIDSVGENEAPATYNVELLSVSPDEAANELQAAFRCVGMEDIENPTEEMQIDALLSYGVYATLWSQDGNNIRKLMKEVRKQAQASQIFYGFMMDRPVNALGNSGWDFQRGTIGFFKKEYI